MRKPLWLLKPRVSFEDTLSVRNQINGEGLNTVCRSARCPNMGECYSKGVATFMILGDTCSRNCGFCDVPFGKQLPLPDPLEPFNVAEAVKSMGLSHVVLTSVTRDDLEDGGAEHFAKTVTAVKETLPKSSTEVLTPDFLGNLNAIDTVTESSPDVFNHNIETVPSLYRKVRPKAVYSRSLSLISRVKKMAPDIVTKSGMMLGLGENYDEVIEAMRNLRSAGCDVLTLGQYLMPTKKSLPVVEYIDPSRFSEYGQAASDLGFSHVASAPFVRSSYHADEAFKGATAL